MRHRVNALAPRQGILAIVSSLVLVIAGCAAAAPPTPTPAPPPTATAVPATATTAAAPAGAATASTTIQVRTDAKLGGILADNKGMTLYRFAKDGPNTSACTGGCAQTWPPLPADGKLTLPAGVPGTLASFARADGLQQVTYNGIPLYRFVKDVQPGDTTGQGVGGVWTVVNPGATASEPAPAAQGTAAPAASAQANAPASASPSAVPTTRMTGPIQSISGDKITLADGSSFTVSPQTRIIQTTVGSASDLQTGMYVAITAKRQPDNTLLASLVNVFPPSLRGAAGGQFPLPTGDLMTNATISQVNGNSFSVTFPGGGANVTLAPDAKVNKLTDVAATDLKNGMTITAQVANGAARSISIQQ